MFTYDSSGYLRRRVDGELQLGFLSVIHRQTFHQEAGESWAGASTERVEDEESLQVKQNKDIFKSYLKELF